MKMKCFQEAVIPVSYTHLDVYKRQKYNPNDKINGGQSFS